MQKIMFKSFRSLIPFLLFCGVIFCDFISAFAQFPASSEQNLDLSGEWKFQLEPGQTKGGKGNDQKGWQDLAFDDEAWENIMVGQQWEQQGYNYNGIAWYRRSFVIPEEWKGSTLVFSGGMADDGAEIYFNGSSLGIFTFKKTIMVQLPQDKVNWGGKNIFAVRVWDWYKGGGLLAGKYSVERLRPFNQGEENFPKTQSLALTQQLSEGVLEQARWEYGLESIGVDDSSRLGLAVKRNAFENEDAVEITVKNPNTKQYVDYILSGGEKGADWAREGYDYISFWYKTNDLKGDLSIRLNKGRLKAGKRSLTTSTYVEVSPGGWTQVILPFSQFMNEYKSNYDRVVDHREPVYDPSFVDSIGIGTENNRLQDVGSILLANFEVGTFSQKKLVRGIPLEGLWHFKKDNIRPDGEKSVFGKNVEAELHQEDRDGYGLELGYQNIDFDETDWQAVQVPGLWMAMGLGYKGPAWYRQQVLIPDAWQGKNLELYLGSPAMFGDLYWNGEKVGKVEEGQEAGFYAKIPSEKVKMDGPNLLAVRVVSWRPRRSGIEAGRMEILPENSAEILLADVENPKDFLPPDQFEMGAKPGKEISFRFQFAASESAQGILKARLHLRDCYFRTITEQTVPLILNEKRAWEGTVNLNDRESRQLYYSEFFETKILLEDEVGQPVDALYIAVSKLRYSERDAIQLPPLADDMEETPFGKLRLVDVIYPELDADTDPHPYKEGGIRASWVGTQAYSSWKKGVTVQEYDGRKYREASNNEYFGYRIGRGQMKPHTPYLVRILVPEDKVRYANIEFKTARNYQGVGYRNGVDSDHPHFSYPLKNGYTWVDSLVITDDTTYGFEGFRKVSTENGFWVFFYDIGRVYAGAYEEGPAVAEIRLYEITEPEKHYPLIHYPQGEKSRVLMMDWERQPEQPPLDTTVWAKLVGLNAVSPVIQKWAFHGFWHSDLGFAPPGWYKASPEGEDDRDIYQKWLDVTRELEMTFIPRVEYGGSSTLPVEARVINSKGVIDPCGRFCAWGANILHEATWTEYETLIDELIGEHYQDNPQLAGMLWRQRNERIKCSYGKADVELFCKETGHQMPEGDAASIAQWAAVKLKTEYHAWWQGKRRDFIVRATAYLRSYDPEMKMMYYNWDEDSWAKFGALPGTTNKGMPHAAQTPEEWGTFYNVRTSRDFQMNKFPPRRSDEFYLDLLSDKMEPHKQIFPELFANQEGLYIFAPINREDLANSTVYQNYFKTGGGFAMSHLFEYEERARWNVQGDNHEGSMIGPGGADYAMAYEVLACFYGDPNIITFTTYTMGRTFVSEIRRFAQAYLALPDKEGTILDEACGNPDVRVRRYPSDESSYIGVVYKGIEAGKLQVRVPADGTREVWNQVSGLKVDANREGVDWVWEIDASPMSVHAFHLK